MHMIIVIPRSGSILPNCVDSTDSEDYFLLFELAVEPLLVQNVVIVW